MGAISHSDHATVIALDCAAIGRVLINAVDTAILKRSDVIKHIHQESKRSDHLPGALIFGVSRTNAPHAPRGIVLYVCGQTWWILAIGKRTATLCADGLCAVTRWTVVLVCSFDVCHCHGVP